LTSWLALDFNPIERDIRGEATKEPINAGFRQHQARAKREVSFLNPFLCRCGLAGKLGRRRVLKGEKKGTLPLFSIFCPLQTSKSGMRVSAAMR
jgi:hypothetical protein